MVGVCFRFAPFQNSRAPPITNPRNAPKILSGNDVARVITENVTLGRLGRLGDCGEFAPQSFVFLPQFPGNLHFSPEIAEDARKAGNFLPLFQNQNGKPRNSRLLLGNPRGLTVETKNEGFKGFVHRGESAALFSSCQQFFTNRPTYFLAG